MWGSRAQDQGDETGHAAYVDPRASLLVRCLDESTWIETVRLAVTAEEVCSWLGRQPGIEPESVSDHYTANWCAETARFRCQLLEVPRLERRNAAPWNLSKTWRKKAHRLFIAALLSVGSGETGGIRAVNRAVRRMATDLGGEIQIVSNYELGRQALKREVKLAHAVSLIGLDPQRPAQPPKPAEWDAIERELTSVPMASAEKPDINGFREGERVRLINAFSGDHSRYEIGHTGTVLVTNTSPADVDLLREGDLHEVLMDGGGIIMTTSGKLEKIPGMANVIYSLSGERVHVEL
jgi:hypothetical protein